VADVFGDLREWARVLATLDDLRVEGELGDHQQGLARLVRYPGNWRLQEAALTCALEIDCSCDHLIADTVNALVCRDTPLRSRVMAAHAAGHLLSCYPGDDQSHFDPKRAYETLEHLAAQPQPPILADALAQALRRARPQAARKVEVDRC